jgi:acetyl-CoA carboxylase carboxyltransferase component
MFGNGTGSTDRCHDSSSNPSCSSVFPLKFSSDGSSGKKIDEKALEKRAEVFKNTTHLQSSAYYTSAHVLDDGIIDPRDTRDVLGMCLEIITENGVRGNPGFSGVSRL